MVIDKREQFCELYTDQYCHTPEAGVRLKETRLGQQLSKGWRQRPFASRYSPIVILVTVTHCDKHHVE
jgi:hypothetical protein